MHGAKLCEYCIVYKVHPLEDLDPFEGLHSCFNASDSNIYDLLDMCDLVWSFNSGVGVLALCLNKYCLLSGDAFYHDPLFNKNVSCSRGTYPLKNTKRR